MKEFEVQQLEWLVEISQDVKKGKGYMSLDMYERYVDTVINRLSAMIRRDVEC